MSIICQVLMNLLFMTIEEGGLITLGTLAIAGCKIEVVVTIGIMHVTGTASLPLMAAPRSDEFTFEIVQAAAIDPGTLG